MPTAQQLLAEKQRIESLLNSDRDLLAFLKRAQAAAEARDAPASQLRSRQIRISDLEQSLRRQEANLIQVDRQIAASNQPTTANPPDPEVPVTPTAASLPAPTTTTTTVNNPPNPQVPAAPSATPRVTAPAGDQITDFTFEDNASLGYSSPPATAANVEDAAIVRTPPVAANVEDAFIAQPATVQEITDPDTGISPYGEEDEPFDPDFRLAPDPALFTEDYIQQQDNPIDIVQDQDTGFSPYGEENEPADIVPLRDPFEVDGDPGYGSAETEFEQDNPNLVTIVAPDPYEIDGAGIGLTEEEIQEQDNPTAAARQQATLALARQQQAIAAQQRQQASSGDWRVKLRLAPGATYLYKSDSPGILQPLAVTDGVVFPYTPQITTAYRAQYSNYDLTHSNFRGFFYQNSYVDDIVINAKFTAQDTTEANYLLAVIHFFRSVTKMFYGANDAQAGAPPPLVYLQGLGEFQFNLHPCVVASFNYNLPDDIDYIRARVTNYNGTDLLFRRDRQTLPTNPFTSAWSRIENILKPQGINKGAINAPPAVPILGTNNPTYVPTRIDISVTLHPIQSRTQVSKQFNLKQFANGDLLKGGFW